MPYLCNRNRERRRSTNPGGEAIAEVAQLVEHDLAKVGVAGSSPVFRSSLEANGCSNGGIGRHEGLKILWLLQLCGFKSRFEYKGKSYGTRVSVVAEVAQLVEHDLAKVGVAGSSPVFRSIN